MVGSSELRVFELTIDVLELNYERRVMEYSVFLEFEYSEEECFKEQLVWVA